MTRFLRIGIFLLLLPLLTPAAAAQSVESSGGDFVATVTRTFDVSPGGALELDSHAGSITVTAWDQNRVRVEESIRMRRYSRSEAEAYVGRTTYTEQDGSVRVRTPEDHDGTEHDFTVQVPRRYDVDVQTHGGSVTLDGMQGTAKGRTSGGSIRVERVTGAVDITTSGGSLEIDAVDGDVNGTTAGGSIGARDVTGRLDVRTAGGSIEVRDIGGAVDAKTAGGSIRAESVRGPLTVRTAGGDIEVRDAAQDVTAATAGGDVDLQGIGGAVDAQTMGGDVEGRDVNGFVRARTQAGDVEFVGVRGGVNARTSVGDIEVEVVAASFDDDPALELTTHHGDIELVLPADVQASVDAEVESYHGGVDREDVYSDFPLTREGGRSKTLRATGDLNGGGPVVRLRSGGGSIRIEKSDL